MGRGGAGPEFVMALLDWRNDPSGAIRQRFVAMGGDRQVRLTQRTLDEFENEGGRFANLRALGAQDYEAMQEAGDDDGGDEEEVQVAVI